MMALVVTFGSMIEWLMLACLKVDSKMTQSVNQDMSLSRPQIYIYYDIRPSSLQNQKNQFWLFISFLFVEFCYSLEYKMRPRLLQALN